MNDIPFHFSFLKISIIIMFLSGCQIIPNGYKENLIGTWTNLELINTPLGEQNVIYTASFSEDGLYNLETIHPTTGTTRVTFLYAVGYSQPKNAIEFYEYGDNLAHPPVVGTPLYYYFENNFQKLITSTNANMALAKHWEK